jgi:hypothetical protein
MPGKYSAEWWEKIAVIEREVATRQDASSIIDHLIQASASRSPARMTDVKRRDLGSAASKEKSSLAG